MQELLLLIVVATETAGSALIVQTCRLFAFGVRSIAESRFEVLDMEPAHHLLPTEIMTVLSHPVYLSLEPRSHL